MENAFINVKNQSVTITADVEIPANGANGVIICQGGQFGGWSLYLNDGKPAYTYNFLGLGQTAINGSERLAPGKATIKVEFAYDGDGRGKGEQPPSTLTEKQVGSGRIERPIPNLLSREAAGRGRDEGTRSSRTSP